MLKVAVVGCGGISAAHIPEWEAIEEVELVAFCDVRGELLEKYPDSHHYTDLDEMLDSEKIDILDICLPTYLHTEASIKAMEKGINVLCEKPVSLKSSDVELLYKTARENKVQFMVAQVIRFWPEYVKLKEIIDSKRYGKLLAGHMARLSSVPDWSWEDWMLDEKKSGRVAFDLHIHDLDFLVYALGKPESHSVHRSKTEKQDYLIATYCYDDCFISVETAFYAAPYPFRATFRFQFEEAIVSFEDGKMVVYESGGEVKELGGIEDSNGAINLPKTNAYANEIIYFIECVKEKKEATLVSEESIQTVIDIVKNY